MRGHDGVAARRERRRSRRRRRVQPRAPFRSSPARSTPIRRSAATPARAAATAPAWAAQSTTMKALFRSKTPRFPAIRPSAERRAPSSAASAAQFIRKNGSVTIHNSTIHQQHGLHGSRALRAWRTDGTATVDIQSSIIGQSDASFSVRASSWPRPDDDGQLMVTGEQQSHSLSKRISTQSPFRPIDPLLGPLDGQRRTNADARARRRTAQPSTLEAIRKTLRPTSAEALTRAWSALRADIGAYELQTAVAPNAAGRL